jgi:hypothetical protein
LLNIFIFLLLLLLPLTKQKRKIQNSKFNLACDKQAHSWNTHKNLLALMLATMAQACYNIFRFIAS